MFQVDVCTVTLLEYSWNVIMVKINIMLNEDNVLLLLCNNVNMKL